jgi:fluoride exporter
MKSYFWIAVGAGLGGTLRYWCGEIAVTLLGDIFPWGTVLVNVLGSFIIGFFAMLTAPEGRFVVSLIIRQFVMVGFCGGYTTFSAFSLQTQEFVQRGEWLYVSANIVSIALSLFAVWIGHGSAVALNPLPATETNECEIRDFAAVPAAPPTPERLNDGEPQ